MNAGQSVNRHPKPEIYILDIDMESVGSRLKGSYDYGHAHREHGGKRLQQVETAGAAKSGGLSNQSIRMSAMAELK